MRRTISLDGDWQRRDFLDEAWRWSDALRPTDEPANGPPAKAGISAGWRPGRVPGSTIDDAWRAAEIPNTYRDRDSLAAEWVPARTWLYRRSFVVPRAPFAAAALRFDGIDPGGTVLLDGVEVASHTGMFVPLEVDVTERVRPGGPHDLVVAVDPAPLAAGQNGAAVEVRLEDARPVGWPERNGAAYVEHNHITLLPGESLEIRVDWRDVDSSDRALRLTGWNVSERVLRGG